MSKNNKALPKRPPPFSIRFPEAERARMEKLANGVPLAQFIKACVRHFLDNPDQLPKQAECNSILKILCKLLGLLGKSRLASNVNQLAKAVNSGSLPVNPEVEKALMDASIAIQMMRQDLLDVIRRLKRR
ncbi:MAG: hypothetical protein NPIRA05_22300 [Nitrospirales bacterium]|nr:MAG: hypothetical protein NPIRA05_22300 [Nitrospirales bacterium]